MTPSVALEGSSVADALCADAFSRALARFIADHKDPATGVRAGPRLKHALDLALLSSPSSERLRARIVLEVACAVSGAAFADVAPLASPAALAVELAAAHCCVHDALPLMDNALTRRASLSASAAAASLADPKALHNSFDDATAVLTGDALLADAFALLASASLNPAEQVRELALATGSCAMDLAGIERRRPARLIAASAVLGGLCVDADDEQLLALRHYGDALGASRRAGLTRSLAVEASERAQRHAKKLGRFSQPLVELARSLV